MKKNTKAISNRKKHSPKRWVVERTNSWHNKFRKLFTRYEKKVENYLGLVQFSCCIIIYKISCIIRINSYIISDSSISCPFIALV